MSSRLFDRVNTGTKSHGRRDDGVAMANPLSEQREVQGGGARTKRQGCGRPHGGTKLLLKTLHLRACRDPIRAQSVDHFVDFFLAEARAREW